MRKRVVIIGLGDTGLLTAVRLSREFDVAAVSTKPCMVSGQELGLRLARPRAWRSVSVVAFARYRGLDGVDVVHGRATRVDFEDRLVHVETASGALRALPYDALLVASGVRNGFWRNGLVEDQSSVDDGIADAARQVARATSLAVVGGGAGGVGVALNVRRRFPDKPVHLFISREEVLPGYHPRVRAEVSRRLRAEGVTLHRNHRAAVPDDFAGGSITRGPISWTSGEPAFAVDRVVWAIGRVAPNTDFLPAAILDEGGFVRVNACLGVPGMNGVFAVGDVAATDRHRSSARNRGHALAAANIRANLRGRPDRMKPLRALPTHRWGSVFGLQPEGMRVYFPGGRSFGFPRWISVWLLFRFIVGEVLFRGIRDFRVER